MKIRLILTSIVFAAVSLCLQSQDDDHDENHNQTPKYYQSQEYTLKGIVLEAETHQPLEYVKVSLYKLPDSSFVAGSMTYSSGTFDITTKQRGNFYLLFNFIGYAKLYKDSIAITDNNKTIDLGQFELKPQAIGLNQVEVNADRAMVSYKLNKKVVTVGSNLAAAGGTAVDVLQQTSAIKTDIEGNVTMHGSSSYTVMIDGKQSPLEGSDALNQVPASVIDRIEIITNPSVNYDPDGTAGIINIVTRKGSKNLSSYNFNLSGGTGPSYSGDASMNIDLKKISIQAGINYRNNQFNATNDRYRETYSYNRLDTSFLYSNGEMERYMKNFTLRANIDYRITDHQTLSLGINRNDFTMGFDNSVYNTLSDTVYLTKDNSKLNPKFWEFNLSDKFIFGNPDHKLDLLLNVQFIDRTRETDMTKTLNSIKTGIPADLNLINSDSVYVPYNSEETEDRTNIRFEANYSRPIGKNSKIETGYNLRSELSALDYTQTDEYSKLDILWGDEYVSRNSDFSNLINSVYVLGTTQISAYSVNIGVRGEYTNRVLSVDNDSLKFTYNHFDYYPSFAVSREWKNGHKVILSYSKRVNRPRDFFLNPIVLPSDGFSSRQGNPDLKPEFIHTLELNYQKMFGENSVTAELFYRETIDKIDHREFVDSLGVSISQFDNIGKDINTGIDLSSDLRLFKILTIDPSISLFYQKMSDDQDVESVKHETYTYSGNLTTFILLPSKTRIQLNFKYDGPEVEVNGTEDPSWSAGFAIQQSFYDRKLTMTLRMDDIFNTHKRSGTTNGENFYSESKFQRTNQFISFMISYKINPQKNDRKRPGRDENNNGNGNDYMDMGM